MNASRVLALEALRRIEDEGAYANLLLPTLLAECDLSGPDRRFVTELVYGSTRMRRACDALVDRFVSAPPDATTRRLLRLGAYQLAFAGVPSHAAVSETVDCAPRRTRGFVNAVLRRVASTPMKWPDDATRLSYPDWIHRRILDELGDEDGNATLERMNEAPPVSTRIDGYVQDLASQWVAAAVGCRSGEKILDLCAGPGGKATAMATSGALVIGVDRSLARAGLVRGNAERLARRVPVVTADGARPPFLEGSFDRVLVDAPCSGLGALRRRADARWRIAESDVSELATLQSALIAGATRLVRPGGVLVYSVCTLTAAESIEHGFPDDFEPVSAGGDDALPPLEGPWRSYGPGHRLLPHESDTDGMVLLRYRRGS